MRNSFTNPILRAALEQLQAEDTSVVAEASPVDVEKTEVENVDAVAELQSEVDQKEDQVYENDVAQLEANGEEVEEELNEIVDAADALEQLADLALLTASKGLATKTFNAAISIGIESQCRRIGAPSIVAALEEEALALGYDAPKGVTKAADKDAALTLGERAKKMAEALYKSVAEFFKRIKQWVFEFADKAMSMWENTTAKAEELLKSLGELRDGAVIEDQGFIKSLGLPGTDASKCFEDYGRFAAGSYNAISSRDLYSEITDLTKAQNDQDVKNTTSLALAFLTRTLFTVASTDGDDNATVALTPKLVGGIEMKLTYKVGDDKKSTVIKISTEKVETVAPSSINGPSAAAARDMLRNILNWSKYGNEVKTRVKEMEAALANARKEAKSEEEASAKRKAIANLISLTSQLTTVLFPSVMRTNAQVSRKYVAYVAKAIAASKEGKVPGTAVAAA